MIKALQSYGQDDLKKLAERTVIVRKETNNVSDDYTITKKSTATISNSFVALHNSFNKILANLTNIKALQEAQAKKSAVQSKIVTVPVGANLEGAEELSGVVNTLGMYFGQLTKLFNNLDINPPQTQEQETDIDIDKRRRSNRTRRRARGRGLGGKALGVFDEGLDIATDEVGYETDRYGDSMSRGRGLGRTKGSLIGAAVGAVAVMGAGYMAAKAFSSEKTKSPAEKQLKEVVTKTAAVPAARVPTEISDNSYSSQFADYLADTFQNVKNYISGAFGGALFGGGESGGGGATGDYSGDYDSGASTENARIAMEYLTSPEGGGWTTEQAAGMVANFQVESGPDLDTAALNEAGGGQGAHGIAQWRGPRIRRFVEMYGKPIRSASLIEQLDYVNWELENTEARAGRNLRNATTAEEAANIFYRQYERPGPEDRSGGRRVSYARTLALPTPTGGTGLTSPMPGVNANSGFGMRVHPILGYRRMHEGLDYTVPLGTPILAAGNGTVTFRGTMKGYGNTIDIDHGDGLVTRYAHMSRFSISNGSAVIQGQQIGLVGQSGTATGPHLHFEVLQNGSPKNPSAYLDAAPTSFRSDWVAPRSTSRDGPMSTRASRIPTDINTERAMELLVGPRRRRSSTVIMQSNAFPMLSNPRMSVPAQPISRNRTRSRGSASNYTAYHGL